MPLNGGGNSYCQPIPRNDQPLSFEGPAQQEANANPRLRRSAAVNRAGLHLTLREGLLRLRGQPTRDVEVERFGWREGFEPPVKDALWERRILDLTGRAVMSHDLQDRLSRHTNGSV